MAEQFQTNREEFVEALRTPAGQRILDNLKNEPFDNDRFVNQVFTLIKAKRANDEKGAATA